MSKIKKILVGIIGFILFVIIGTLIDNHFPGGLEFFILIFIVGYTIFYIYKKDNEVTSSENNKLSNENLELKNKLNEANNKLHEIQLKEQLNSDIQSIQEVFQCSSEEAREKYDLLKETNFYQKYNFAEDDAERILVFDQAVDFHRSCQKLYIPYVYEKGLNLSVNTLGNFTEYFEDPIYDDIDYKAKLEMINAWANNIIEMNPNREYLLNLIEEWNILPTVPNYHISSDNAMKVARSFIDWFGLIVSEEELIQIANRDYSFFLEDSIPEIFAACVYYSFDLEGLPCTDYHFMFYIQDLFFRSVYYDLRNDWKSVVDNQFHTYIYSRPDPFE